MKFTNVDTLKTTITTNTNIIVDNKTLYLDELLDETFITTYVLLTKSNDNISPSHS